MRSLRPRRSLHLPLHLPHAPGWKHVVGNTSIIGQLPYPSIINTVKERISIPSQDARAELWAANSAARARQTSADVFCCVNWLTMASEQVFRRRPRAVWSRFNHS